MMLICGRCDEQMTVVCGYFSTQPAYYICPVCKCKVKNADYREE